MKRKFVYILTALVIATAVILVYQDRQQRTNRQPITSGQPAPSFLLGEVAKVDGDRIYFTVAAPNLDRDGKEIVSYEQRIARITSGTQLKNQGAPAVAADFKPGMSIVVHYYGDKALHGEIEAERIEIIK